MESAFWHLDIGLFRLVIYLSQYMETLQTELEETIQMMTPTAETEATTMTTTSMMTLNQSTSILDTESRLNLNCVECDNAMPSLINENDHFNLTLN